MRAPRVTLLGGTGFIGRHVTRRLQDLGAEPITVQRGRTGGATPPARRIVADRHDAGALRAALAQAAPAVLVDMIAYTAADAELLMAALPASLERLVLISSGDVYWTYGVFLSLEPAAPPTAPLDEAARLRRTRFPYRAKASGPDDPLYQYEKIEVERVVSAGAGVPVTVLRLPMVYGPEDPQRRIAGYLARLGTGGKSVALNPLEAAWRCTRGYVEDVASAVALSAVEEKAAGATYNLGEPDALTEREWVEAIAEAVGWRGEVVVTPDAQPSLPARWDIPLVTDTGRIRKELGYRESVGRAEGLRRSIG